MQFRLLVALLLLKVSWSNRIAPFDTPWMVVGLVNGWLDGRSDGESFPRFARRLTDVELGALAGVEPVPTRATEEAA